jgi:putrescine transport system substrate-binding protein
VIAPVSDHLSYPNGNRATTPGGRSHAGQPGGVSVGRGDGHVVHPGTLPKATERVRTRIWSKVKNGQ